MVNICVVVKGLSAGIRNRQPRRRRPESGGPDYSLLHTQGKTITEEFYSKANCHLGKKQ